MISSIYNIENIYFYLNFLFATYYGYSREIARLTNRSIIDGLGFNRCGGDERRKYIK